MFDITILLARLIMGGAFITWGIMKLRGNWKEWRLLEGAVSAPVMPTLHPAFLLRQPQAKRQVWSDLLSLAVRLETDSVEEQG